VAGEHVLTLRELNRALLARQLLLERRKLGVQQAVERICAVQAQWPQSPYIGLWTRLSGFRKEQLTRALAQHRVVKTQLFRITLHITSARDYPSFFAVWGPVTRDRTPGVARDQLEELSRRVRAAALKGPITQEQVEELAAEEMGFRWRTSTLTPLIPLPPGGTWSHYGRTQLGAMESVLGAKLPPHDDGAVLLDLPRAPLPDGDTPAPIRFLPKWDSSLLAYAPPERTRILPEKYRSTVIAKNGDVLPTVLVDGFVSATWDVGAKRDLTIKPLRRLTKRERAEIDAEGERLVGFFRS